MAIAWGVGAMLKRRFEEYSRTTLVSGMSGREIAEKMLRDNDLSDVKVISVQGELTDHYNPVNKTVNLSPAVYNGRNAAAAAVAAHECGHAVQHAHAYSMLQLRTMLVPVQNATATILNIIVIASIIGGAFLFQTFPMEQVLLILIGCYGMFTLFSFITLPVEFDASKRALVWLENSRLVGPQEHAKAKDALKWAAMTYVVAALASLTTLLYYVMMFMGRRRD
jgi:hypothetical protein